MTKTIEISFSDMRDAAIAFGEFETALGAATLADALETMLSGQERVAEELTSVLRKDKALQEQIRRADRKVPDALSVPWQKMDVARDIQKIGPKNVAAYLTQASEAAKEGRDLQADAMTRAVKLMQVESRSSAFDRVSVKAMVQPLVQDPKTGKPLDQKATKIRAVAIGALAKLTPEFRSRLRFWTARRPLPKKYQLAMRSYFGWVFKPRAVIVPISEPGGNGSGNPGPSTPTYTQLRFNLHRVDCFDDTDGGEIGADEIELGGTDASGMENAPTGAIIGKFGPTPVGSYRGGDDRTFSPAHVLNQWGLTGLTFPHTFIVNLLMSEKDANNKFRDILDDLAQAGQPVLTELITALSAAAGAAAGAAIGGALGTSIAPLIGSLIGLVAGALIGLIGAWISGAVDPEIFENIHTMAVILDNPHEFRNGSRTTPHETVHYIDHGGHYTVRSNFSLH